MSHIIKLSIDKDISLFENDRFILPALSLRGIKKTRFAGLEYISGLAIGIRFWRWGIYLSFLESANKPTVENKIELRSDTLDNNLSQKISIAKSLDDDILQKILKGNLI